MDSFNEKATPPEKHNVSRPKIYLAGPITGVIEDEGKLWRHYLKYRYEEHEKKFLFLDPTMDRYFGRSPDEGRKIVESDRKAIEECDYIIAKMQIPSIGTAIGIFYGWFIGKDVILICRENIFIELSPVLSYYIFKRVDDEDSAIKEIDEIISSHSIQIPLPPLRKKSLTFEDIYKLLKSEFMIHKNTEGKIILLGNIINEIKDNIRGTNLSWDKFYVEIKSILSAYP